MTAMTEEQAIQIARAFAKSNGITWSPPVTAHRSTFRKKGWTSVFYRSRDTWVVNTLSDVLGGGSASIHVDEKTGAILTHSVYDE